MRLAKHGHQEVSVHSGQNLYFKPGVNKKRGRMEGMMEGGREREALQSPNPIISSKGMFPLT